MITALIYLVVLLLILGLVWWLTTLIPLPDPIPLVLRVAFAVIVVLVVINFLLGLVGHGLPMRY